MIFTATRFKDNDRLSRTGDNSPLMKMGERGAAVAIIQQSLSDLKKYKFTGSTDSLGNLDGIYGTETKSNVWQFQIDQNLEDKDGIVGGKTLARLDKLLAITPVPPKPRPVIPPRPLSPSKLGRLINVDKLSAKRLFPAQINPFYEVDDTYVRARGHASVRVCQMVHKRFYTLGGIDDVETSWNKGLEAWWFGAYSVRKYKKVKRTFLHIQSTLISPKLQVDCRPGLYKYGRARPGIRKIKLGRYWLEPGKPGFLKNEEERVQTLIHEAAHIAGRWNTAEKDLYGKGPSHNLADEGMKATRNADSYGYYALDIAMFAP